MEVDNEDEDEDSADMIREVVSGKKPAYRALGQTEVDAEAVKVRLTLPAICCILQTIDARLSDPIRRSSG